MKGVLMSKTSIATKAISLAILIALLLAAFPVTGAIAKGNTDKLETKWSQLVDSYNRQYVTHSSAHNWANHWLDDNRNASDAKKAEIERHLNICNTALSSATAIVLKHNGFDAKGKVTDKAAAQKSIKDLAFNLQRHAASIRNLNEHVNQ
jgi:hypothetical protein